jgi:diguanylate cyclase (GGDEF)-like protein
VAGRLAANVRQADTVGQVGGDEFMVLCRDASADDALALAERLIVASAARWRWRRLGRDERQHRCGPGRP